MDCDPHLSIGCVREHRRNKSAASSCTARGMEPRRGTPEVVMWPDFQSDARPLDTGPAPRRNTEGGIQPADKSLINRRLKRSISCSVQIPIKQIGYDPMRDRSKLEFVARSVIFFLTTDIRDYFPAQNACFANRGTDAKQKKYPAKTKTPPADTGGVSRKVIRSIQSWFYSDDFSAIARPILMRLSEITPSPTHRFIPSSPL